MYTIEQNVYWSDIRHRTIHRAQLDGSNPVVLLGSSHGVGAVDGINSYLLIVTVVVSVVVVIVTLIVTTLTISITLTFCCGQ